MASERPNVMWTGENREALAAAGTQARYSAEDKLDRGDAIGMFGTVVDTKVQVG